MDDSLKCATVVTIYCEFNKYFPFSEMKKMYSVSDCKYNPVIRECEDDLKRGKELYLK